jgi:hypothetical protein
MVIPLRRPGDVPALVRDLQVARALVQEARAGSCGAIAARAAQQALLDCLTALSGELTARGLPVPRTLHAEARLYDEVLATHRR